MTVLVASGVSRTVATGLTFLAVVALGAAAGDRAIIAQRVGRLTRETQWQLVQSLPIKFRTFHPQGMVKIGETFFVSSVEVRTPTRRLSPPQHGYDRDAGEGSGHLFKIDKAGNLYVSGPGGLWILSPEGKHLGTIIGPKHPHNFAWGDTDGRTLYLCARSGLYRIKLNIEGIRP